MTAPGPPSPGLLQVLGHAGTLQSLRTSEAASLLFIGPPGVGRRRAARWLAALLNCAAQAAERPCGQCDSCRRFEESHPDYREIRAPSVTGSGRRNLRPEIRIGQLVPRPGESEVEPLSRWLEQRPAFRRRVGVIDGAHRLTAAAANSFLKMLEEPPSYATIVLIAPSTGAVLPTIASRCTVFRFGAVDTSGLEPPDHPAHRLGKPGPLLQASEDGEELREAADRFVESLSGDLEAGLSAADALASAWQASSDPALPEEELRERLRGLDSRSRAAADDLILACGEAIEGYSPPALATRVLLLELRALLTS